MAGSSRETSGLTRAVPRPGTVLSTACTSQWACWLLLVQKQGEKTHIYPFNLSWGSPFFYIIFIFSQRVLKYALHYEVVIKAVSSFTSYFPKHILRKARRNGLTFLFLESLCNCGFFCPVLCISWEGMQMWKVLSKETGNGRCGFLICTLNIGVCKLSINMARTVVRNTALKDNGQAPWQLSPWYQSAILEHLKKKWSNQCPLAIEFV